MPPRPVATTSVSFQPLGGGKPARCGDLVVIAKEVQPVLVALPRGGANLVEARHHNLTDDPHPFFVHYWASAMPSASPRPFAGPWTPPTSYACPEEPPDDRGQRDKHLPVRLQRSPGVRP
ncbi:DUF1259 domain-containing protein [Streptomyces mirabilis]|uniref:DUF1259 domain-containing protein n=1 Tax=Streptomyces mirabilis TaxID=68239 RepID=UPI0033BB5C72